MKVRKTTSTALVGIPEQPSRNKPPVDDAAAPKNPPAGGRAVSRIAAWPASATVRMIAQPRVPVLAIAAISERISDAAADPALPLHEQDQEPPQRIPLAQQPPLAQPTIRRGPCLDHLSSIGRQRRHPRECPREHHSARLLKMPPTAPADDSLVRTPLPAHVRRIRDEPLRAVRVRGITAPVSTTDPLSCAAAADWPVHGWL